MIWTRCSRCRRASRCWPKSTSSPSARRARWCGSTIPSSKNSSSARAASAHWKRWTRRKARMPASINTANRSSDGKQIACPHDRLLHDHAADRDGAVRPLVQPRPRAARAVSNDDDAAGAGIERASVGALSRPGSGKVAAIGFDPKVTGQILVTLNINPDAPITKTTYGTLGYQGVTGIAYVQLDDDT